MYNKVFKPIFALLKQKNMIKNFTLTLAFISLISISLFSQITNKVYFTSSGIASTNENGYYYRVQINDSLYKSYYTSTDNIYFEGNIKNASNENEAKNIYSGNCKWYYKNEKVKLEKNYNSNGKEDGVCIYFFESGKKWKEYTYKNGNIEDSKYIEYTEQGNIISIFEENFDNNKNDWDLYTSDLSSSRIENGAMVLESKTKEGTSRFINFPINASDYIIELNFDNSEVKNNKIGIIWGFKDWKNYNYFTIANNSFYLGSCFEGIDNQKFNGIYTRDIDLKGKNKLKLYVTDGNLVVLINDILQSKTREMDMLGSKIGVAISGKCKAKIDYLFIKEFTNKNNAALTSSELKVRSTGSGIFISKSGVIVTNFHVIDNNSKLIVDVTTDGVVKSYEAEVLQKDEQNDLALIKIKDPNFKLSNLSYSFAEQGAIAVGGSVFSIGYPYALSGMGREVKFVDGKISAKTGFNGSINSFQTSIPVQPGNSGGPVFNDKAQLVGIINAKFGSADNVSYAIKLNYLLNLIDLLPDFTPSTDKSLESLPLEEKIKTLSNYVVLIKVQ